MGTATMAEKQLMTDFVSLFEEDDDTPRRQTDILNK